VTLLIVIDNIPSVRKCKIERKSIENITSKVPL